MQIVLITGSRTLANENFFRRTMEQAHAHSEIAHLVLGDCPTGVDALALRFALDYAIPHTVHVADWNAHGKAAGPLRNKDMVLHLKDLYDLDAGLIPAYGIAFTDKPLSASRGTASCVKQLLELTAFPVRHFREHGPNTGPVVIR